MNLERKFEPYKLIPEGKVYKVENFDVENLISANVSNNKSKTIKTNNNNEMKVLTKKNIKKKKKIIIIKKKNKIEYLKHFFDGLTFLKKGFDSFQVNGFTFFNAVHLYNFLFKNSKKINGIDILKLRKIIKNIKKKMFEKICKNAKIALQK